jgi:nucleotide-binding universal stress UspA family protein
MYRHILVPVDGSSTSARALQEALGFARQQTAELELVYVMEDALFLENEAYINYEEVQKSARSAGEKTLAQAQAAVRQAGMTAEQRLLEARGERIASVIIEEARRWPADLIVIRHPRPLRLQPNSIRQRCGRRGTNGAYTRAIGSRRLGTCSVASHGAISSEDSEDFNEGEAWCRGCPAPR